MNRPLCRHGSFHSAAWPDYGVRVARVEVHRFPVGESLVRIRTAEVRRMLSYDTVPHPTNAIRPAPLVVTALREIL